MASVKNEKEESVSNDEDDETIIQNVRLFLPKFLTWITLYFVGYFNFSIAWLITPLLLSCLRKYWRKKRHRKLIGARQAALSSEREMIKNRKIRAEDLPSWVFFPDKVIFF